MAGSLAMRRRDCGRCCPVQRAGAGSGESGRQVVAQLVHQQSSCMRAACRLMPDCRRRPSANCWRHGPPAQEKHGVFSRADGERFLDEIGEMPPTCSLVLRARVGRSCRWEAIRRWRSTRDWWRQTKPGPGVQGPIPHDLYYRINVVELVVLHARTTEDILPLLSTR